MSKRNSSAFTLVEVLVAIVIFGIAWVSVLSFFTFGTQKRVAAQKTNFALQLAKDKIEHMKAQDYYAVDVSSDEITTNFGIVFTVNWGTSPELTEPDGEKYKIAIATITWPNAVSSVILKTIISP